LRRFAPPPGVYLVPPISSTSFHAPPLALLFFDLPPASAAASNPVCNTRFPRAIVVFSPAAAFLDHPPSHFLLEGFPWRPYHLFRCSGGWLSLKGALRPRQRSVPPCPPVLVGCQVFVGWGVPNLFPPLSPFYFVPLSPLDLGSLFSGTIDLSFLCFPARSSSPRTFSFLYCVFFSSCAFALRYFLCCSVPFP